MSLFKYSSLGVERQSTKGMPDTLARQTGHPAYSHLVNLYDETNYEHSSEESSTL